MVTSRLWIYRLISSILPETRCFRLKASLLRWCGAKVGTNVRINSSVCFSGGGELEIGDDVWIGAQDFIMSTHPAKVVIGSRCDLGPQVSIVTGTHEIGKEDEGHIAGDGKSLSVIIGDGCWLGTRSVILPGVSLADKTLVGAGAVVVTSNRKGNELVAGVPAIVKKSYSC